MNNDKTKVDDVSQWIEEYHQSKQDYKIAKQDYDNCRQDTETAVELLENEFVKIDFSDANEIVDWFASEFRMRSSRQSSTKDPSYYRGFVAIENDNIINLRVSRHYGTEESLQRAYGNGKHKPEIEYHIIADKKPITYANNTPITRDCFLWNIEIIVDEWFLAAMKTDEGKRDIIFKLVYVLTFGEYTDRKNESLEYTHSQYVLPYNEYIQSYNKALESL